MNDCIRRVFMRKISEKLGFNIEESGDKFKIIFENFPRQFSKFVREAYENRHSKLYKVLH